MKLKTLVLTLAAGAFAASAIAADTNFTPANMSGSSPASSEAKSRQAAPQAQPASSEPGFWDREGKRSGLAGTGGNFGNNVKKMWGVPDWFKNQQEEYKKRHPETDR